MSISHQSAAKQAASSSIQCLTAAQNAGQSNQSRASQDELLTDCRSLADALPRLAEGVKGSVANPESTSAQLNLINASEQFLQVSYCKYFLFNVLYGQ